MFYELSKAGRLELVAVVYDNVNNDLLSGDFKSTVLYFADGDTYIRKTAYLIIGRLYAGNKELHPKIIQMLDVLFSERDFRIRQTVINAAGEIGRKHFSIVQHYFDKGLFDVHHSPRNAVIGSIKKMGQANPRPVLEWAAKYLHHPDKEVRRQICHGIELRGRKYPQDILPLLKEIQHDKTPRVRNTLIHVLGQISYQQGCLQIVIEHLKTWDNEKLVEEALKEIIDVHYRYRNFSALTQTEAISYIRKHF